MSVIDWLVVVTCNVVLIGVGILIFSGKLDDRLMLSWKKNAPHHRLWDMNAYHKWALALCVVAAILIDVLVFVTMR